MMLNTKMRVVSKLADESAKITRKTKLIYKDLQLRQVAYDDITTLKTIEAVDKQEKSIRYCNRRMVVAMRAVKKQLIVFKDILDDGEFDRLSLYFAQLNFFAHRKMVDSMKIIKMCRFAIKSYRKRRLFVEDEDLVDK